MIFMKRASYIIRSYEPCSMLHYPCTSRPGCWRSHGAWGCPCPGASWTLVLNDCPIEAPSQEWVSECVLLLFILNWHQDERHCLWKAEVERHCLSAAAAPMAPLPAPLNPIGPYMHWMRLRESEMCTAHCAVYICTILDNTRYSGPSHP